MHVLHAVIVITQNLISRRLEKVLYVQLYQGNFYCTQPLLASSFRSYTSSGQYCTRSRTTQNPSLCFLVYGKDYTIGQALSQQ